MFNLAEVCRRHGITPRGVIHVGAHEGQELAQYLAMGVRRVVMIEANPAVFSRLQARVAVAREPGIVAVQRAVSDSNGTATLRVTSFDQSSSLLPLKKHLEHYPDIRETHAIEVRTSTIDSLLTELGLRGEDFNLLNVDVQGAELMVMRGAVGALRHVEAIFTEVNFEEMYAGCAQCGDLDAFLEPLEFRRVAVTTPYSPSWGDACYVRSPAVTMATLGQNGRFGNQLFQYAFLRLYAQRHRMGVQVPADWIGRGLYGLNDAPITRALPRMMDETTEPAASPVLNAAEPLYDVDLCGYFQFPTSYYAAHKEFLRSTFRPVAAIRAALDAAWARLCDRGSNVIGLHVRRGDYEDTHVNPFRLIAPTDALVEWLKRIWATRERPVLFLCSDELPKVLPAFAQFNPVTAADLAIEWPPPGAAPELRGTTDFFPEFDLLGRCEVLCISNSTFSFAAAMLNETPGAVFYRPTPEGQIVPFDPWDSPVLLRRAEEPLASPALAAALEAYAKEQTERTLAPLVDARRRTAEAWLALGDDLLRANFQGALGRVHRALLESGMRTDPQQGEPSADESKLVARLLDALARGPASAGFVQALLAAQLFRRADQLPMTASLDAIPDWLQGLFMTYLLAQPEVFTETGECDRYHRFLREWEGELLRQVRVDRPSERTKAAVIEFSMRANMIPIYFTADDVKEVHVRRARLLETALRFTGRDLDDRAAPRPAGGSKLRVGILAAHFGPQTETFHTLPYYEHVDRARVDVTLFTLQPMAHPLSRYCASRADRVVHLTGDTEQQVSIVRAAHLDLLVVGTNVGAVTNAITVLALHRLARVQATLFSSPTTTGFRNIDVFVSGELSEGPGAQEQYTERLIQLPGCGFCFGYAASGPEVVTGDAPTRASLGLPEDAVVFASGANCYKIIPETIDTWAQIIAQVPGSRLLLYPFGAAWSSRYPVTAFMHMVYGAFARHGLESDRLVVLNAQPNRTAVKQCLVLCDVYLDSLRHAGGHSLVDPLELGMPSVSVEGPFLRSRHGAAMLRSIGLDALVAEDEAEYVRMAIELGRDAGLRGKRREQVLAAMRAGRRSSIHGSSAG